MMCPGSFKDNAENELVASASFGSEQELSLFFGTAVGEQEFVLHTLVAPHSDWIRLTTRQKKNRKAKPTFSILPPVTAWPEALDHASCGGSDASVIDMDPTTFASRPATFRTLPCQTSATRAAPTPPGLTIG